MLDTEQFTAKKGKKRDRRTVDDLAKRSIPPLLLLPAVPIAPAAAAPIADDPDG